MSKFAKLLEVGEDQVLIFMEYDDDIDETVMHQVVSVDGIRADIKLSFHGEKQEESAKKYLVSFGLEKAQGLREMVVNMFNK